jgi:hypothetical protein
MDDICDFEQQQNQRQRELSKICAAHSALGKYIHPTYQDPAWTKQLDPDFVAGAPDTNYTLYNDLGLPTGIDWERFFNDQAAKEAARPINENALPYPQQPYKAFSVKSTPSSEEEKTNPATLRASIQATKKAELVARINALSEPAKSSLLAYLDKDAALQTNSNQAKDTSIIDRVDCRTMDRALLRSHLQKEREQEILAERQRKKT